MTIATIHIKFLMYKEKNIKGLPNDNQRDAKIINKSQINYKIIIFSELIERPELHAEQGKKRWLPLR